MGNPRVYEPDRLKDRAVIEKANTAAGETIKELKKIPREERRSGKVKKAKKAAE